MLVRQLNIVIALATALFAATLTSASAQPLAGTRLGVSGDVLAQVANSAVSDGSGRVLEVRDRWRRWRRHNRRWNRRRYYNNGPSFQLYITPRYTYPAPRTYRRSGCDYWSDRCVANWGYRNPDYYGCLRYHGCY